MTKKQKKTLIRIIVATVLTLLLRFLPLEGEILGRSWNFWLFFIPYFLIGYDILTKAVKGILRGHPFDENFLMTVATVGAIALGDSFEGVAVMLFYQIGELFQNIAVCKSRRNIAELMNIRPDYANLQVNGEWKQVDPQEVPIGSIILVKTGEKVPLDGIVTEGSSTLNTAALTGESVPRTVHAGDEVLSGCVNGEGTLYVQTTKEFGASTVSKILELVENASSKKSRSENFISKFARVYTPVVCGSALLLAVLPPVVRLLQGLSPDWADWLYRALTFLVISCPCALVISIPLGFFAGIGGASHAGILIKGSNYMETLSQVKYVAFDKTGTITQGVFDVSGVHHGVVEDSLLLQYAALAESYSTHPISLSLRKAYAGKLDQSRVSDVKEISGEGVEATIDGKHVAVGNDKLMRRMGVESIPCHSVGTIVHVAVDGTYYGHILIEDTVKPQAVEAMRRLKKQGVKKTVMLTGDSRKVAEAVAREVGIDEVHAELMPQNKVDEVEKLLAGKGKGEKVAFVGDGINDAPVLTRADLGIAMGALGSDAAIEAADVVLMDDNPRNISKAIAIAKKCMRIVYENIVFAIAVKLICLVLGALGIANMWVAIFADVGVMVIAVLNSIRVLRVPKD